jgi:primosomal protein N' (replication factor Y)
MDADTTRAKGGHELRLAEFEALSHGVLIGTQMVAKGLDYADVTLVGVLDADTVLHLPDFRAAERTYQLLSQVAGRAGRGDRPGHVVIQTYWPDHPAIRAAAAHDRNVFVPSELAERQELGYPPYARLVRFMASGRTKILSEELIARVANVVRADAPSEWRVLGPAPAVISRLKGQHRSQLLVFGPEHAPLGRLARDVLANVPREDGLTLVADVDPVDLL